MAADHTTEQAPPEVHHYNHIGEVPWDIQKYDAISRCYPSLTPSLEYSPTDHPHSYWRQRYNIFHRYDEGVWLTDDAWFGVTPEPVAK